MKTFKTPKGKGITMFNEGHSVKIKFTTGGELPQELSGKYTATDHAETAILKYLDGMKNKTATKTKE